MAENQPGGEGQQAQTPATPAQPQGGEPQTTTAQQTTEPQGGDDLQAKLDAALADVARLEREKEDVRIQKEGTLKKEAKRQELLSLATVLGVQVETPDNETIESLTEKITGKAIQPEDTSKDDALRQARTDAALTREMWEQGIDPSKVGYLEYLLTKNDDFKALNPEDGDFGVKIKALVGAEVEKDSSLKASGGPSTSGAEVHGGAGNDATITKEQFGKMSVDEKSRLFRTNRPLYDRLVG